MDNKELSVPEAPLSISMDVYYKGVHVMITRRRYNETEKMFSIPVTQIILDIDDMLKRGFKPSWNEQTNGQYSAEIKETKDPDPDWVREPSEDNPGVVKTASKINWKQCTKHNKWFDGDKFSQCFLCAQGK